MQEAAGILLAGGSQLTASRRVSGMFLVMGLLFLFDASERTR